MAILYEAECKNAGVVEWAAGRGILALKSTGHSKGHLYSTGQFYPKGCGPPVAPRVAPSPVENNSADPLVWRPIADIWPDTLGTARSPFHHGETIPKLSLNCP